MKVLTAASPNAGHPNALLSIATLLSDKGHQASGLSEDKDDVNARVGRSSAGIDFATNEPSGQEFRSAVMDVLEEDQCDSSAKRLAHQFALAASQSELVRIVEELATLRPKVPEGIAA